MSPNLRRAFHQALDIVLDALEDEAKEEKPKRKRRTVDAPPAELPSDVSPEELAKIHARLSRAGYKPRAA